MSRVLAGVFVGGRGTRMGGVPKGLMRTPEGTTIAQRLHQLLVASGAEVVLVGASEAYASMGLESLPDETAEQVREYFQLTESLSAWPVIRSALATVSRLAVIPIQDLLDLPALSALNQPGTAEGNWQWRYTEEQLSRLAAERLETLRHWIRLYDRTGSATLRDYSEPPPKAPAR